MRRCPTPSRTHATRRCPRAPRASRRRADTRRDPLGREPTHATRGADGEPPSRLRPRLRRGRAWTGRALDAGIAAFAAFTLAANATVFLGGSLYDLMGAAAGALCVLIVAVLLAGRFWPAWRRDGAGAGEAFEADTDAGEPMGVTDEAHDTWPPAWQAAAATAGVLGAGVFVWTGSLLAVWASALAVSGFALAAPFVARAGAFASPEAPPPRATRGPRWLLPVLMLLCATTVAVAHRADHDDAFYLNIAVAAADDPDAPLLAADTLHGYADVPLGLPVFRVLSYELALALESRWTGVPALVLAHVVWPPIFAALIPLAWARLLRVLAPRRWPWLLVGVVASFFLLADGRASHGEFALLRLQQGKSIFLALLWPLVAHAGLAFGARPSLRRWSLLMAGQIAAVGLSTNALWLAPAVGGLGMFVGALQRQRESLADAAPDLRRMGVTLGLGALASTHAVAMALVLRAETLRAFSEAPHPLPSLQHTSARFMGEAVEVVAGRGLAAAVLLFAVVVAPAIAPGARLRRFVAAFTLAACALFWNPVWAHLVATQITGPDTYFRVLWLWPVPIAVAVLLCAATFVLGRTGRSRPAPGVAAFVLSALLLFGLGGAVATPSPANGVALHAPSVKIAASELDLARALARHAGPDQFVLAPADASRWLPLLHDHPHPLVVREMLLDVLHDRLGQRELTLRAQLTRMVGGEVRLPRSGELLALEIEAVPLQAVALQGVARKWTDVRRALRQSPLVRVEAQDDWEIWARPEAPAEDADADARDDRVEADDGPA